MESNTGGNLVSGGTDHDRGHSIGPWIKVLDKACEAG
jgi:hypothetical protein